MKCKSTSKKIKHSKYRSFPVTTSTNHVIESNIIDKNEKENKETMGA
jgi:hypothetical protein